MSISQIKDAIDLRELAREYGQFRSFGKDLVGRCLFHKEDTGSLRIHRTHFFCFGCQAKGDALTFLAKAEGVSVGTAMRQLSARTGIPLDRIRPVTRIQKALQKEDREFCEWWKARRVAYESRRLTGYVRYADIGAVQIGRDLVALRELRGEALRAHVAREATLAERAEWRADKADAERWAWWCVGMLECAEERDGENAAGGL